MHALQSQGLSIGGPLGWQPSIDRLHSSHLANEMIPNGQQNVANFQTFLEPSAGGKQRRRERYKFQKPPIAMEDDIKEIRKSSSIFDWFKEILPTNNAPKTQMRNSSRRKAGLKGSKTEIDEQTFVQEPEDPAVVFFPTNQDSECMDGSSGGGFNTFGFLSMMLAAYNLMGLISNNGNQNNNNDINRNNINNNNNQQVNMANTNSMNMANNMVIQPPLPPGRFLDVDIRETPVKQKRSITTNCSKRSIIDLGSLVVNLILTWTRFGALAKMTTSPSELLLCQQRLVCQAQAYGHQYGDKGAAIMEVGILAILNNIAEAYVTDIPQILAAARTPRKFKNRLNQNYGYTSCEMYPCSMIRI